MPGRPRGPRVIAGEAGGRRLTVPRTGLLRPTADRVKESVFAALGPDRIEDASVLDLYAGTGALGIEALSRGARQATFVEREASAVAAIVTNLEVTGLAGRGRAVRSDVTRFLAGVAPPEAPFDLVLIDPPYDLAGPGLGTVLAGLTGAWLAPTGTVVVERATTSGEPPWPAPWVSTWSRCYGDTLVCFAATSEENV